MRAGRGVGLPDAIRAAVFIAALQFYLVSLTPFVDLTAAASVDPAADRSSGLNQIVFLGLTAALWAGASRAPGRPLLLRPRGLLACLFVWFLFVSAISLHPDIALKRVLLAALVVANAGALLLIPRSEVQFAKLLSLCCLVALAVAYGGVVLLPRLAIHQASEIREPMNAGLWRGQFPHKNAAAGAMVLLAFIGLYVRSAGRRAEGLVIVALSAFFLSRTGGKTATAALPAILVLGWLVARWRAVGVSIVVGGILAINAVEIGCSISPGLRGIVADLGIDPTFTNRIDIWRIAVSAISDRPWTGHGFQLFWQTDEMVYGTGGGAGWAYGAYNGHNAYLDAVVTTGLPGFALAVTWLVFLPLADLGRAKATGNDIALTTLFLRIWLYGIFTACDESLFFQSGSLLWFTMVVSVFGLHFQAKGMTVKAAPMRPRSLEVVHA